MHSKHVGYYYSFLFFQITRNRNLLNLCQVKALSVKSPKEEEALGQVHSIGYEISKRLPLKVKWSRWE